MGKLYITEHPYPTGYLGTALPIVTMPPIASQVVDYSTSTQSTALNTLTRVVAIHTDEVCSIAFGTNPTATTSSRRMGANSTEYFEVTPGHKIAAINNT
jgi:hypothetical protein